MSDAPKIILTLPTGEVRKYSLQMDSVRIGRAPDNTIVLEDPGLSLHHAVLHRRIDTFEIIDLGSTNGLEMDGRRVISHELKHGDQIKVGEVMMRYEVPGMDPVAPPPVTPSPEETAAEPSPPKEADKEKDEDKDKKEDDADTDKPAAADAPKEKGGCMGAFVLFLFTLLAPVVGLHAHHFVSSKGHILIFDILKHRGAPPAEQVQPAADEAAKP